MARIVTTKGRVTIPKEIRDALGLEPGAAVDFVLCSNGEVVLRKGGAKPARKPDRFETARGTAEIKWRSEELMALMRG